MTLYTVTTMGNGSYGNYNISISIIIISDGAFTPGHGVDGTDMQQLLNRPNLQHFLVIALGTDVHGGLLGELVAPHPKLTFCGSIDPNHLDERTNTITHPTITNIEISGTNCIFTSSHADGDRLVLASLSKKTSMILGVTCVASSVITIVFTYNGKQVVLNASDTRSPEITEICMSYLLCQQISKNLSKYCLSSIQPFSALERIEATTQILLFIESNKDKLAEQYSALLDTATLQIQVLQQILDTHGVLRIQLSRQSSNGDHIGIDTEQRKRDFSERIATAFQNTKLKPCELSTTLLLEQSSNSLTVAIETTPVVASMPIYSEVFNSLGFEARTILIY